MADGIESKIDKLVTLVANGFAAVADDLHVLGSGLKSDIDDARLELIGMRSEVADIKADMVTRTDILALSAEIAAIEKHLGISRKIAA